MARLRACLIAVQTLQVLADSVSPDVSGSYVIGPRYNDDPATFNASGSHGYSFQFNMSLAESQYYNCTDPTLTFPCDQDRSITVYIPHQYRDGTEAGLLVAQDGPDFDVILRNIMDNLIGIEDSDRSLPVFILVSINHASAGHDGNGSLRDLQYDTMSGKYADFVSYEVLPAVVANTHIKKVFPNLKITLDPNGRASFGCSSGATAALSMAWFRPHLFRRVAAYSATLVLKDPFLSTNLSYPEGAWDYIDLIKSSEKKPLRIFHHVSQHDLGTDDPEAYVGFNVTSQKNETTHKGCLPVDLGPLGVQPMIVGPVPNGFNNWAAANNLTAASLRTAGYETRFAYSRGACHCDKRVLLQDMPNSLAWLWRGWTPKGVYTHDIVV
jgi:hypothetical protein